jgi:hypothetical protein
MLELEHLTFVNVLQGYEHFTQFCLHFLLPLISLPASSTEPEEGTKQIGHITAWSTAILHSLSTVPIVQVAFLGVRKYLVRFSQFPELRFMGAG